MCFSYFNFQFHTLRSYLQWAADNFVRFFRKIFHGQKRHHLIEATSNIFLCSQNEGKTELSNPVFVHQTTAQRLNLKNLETVIYT